MAIKTSTGLRKGVLDTSPIRTLLNLGLVKVYSGPIPATADAALDPSNTLLYTLSNNATGTGLTFESSAAGGILVKTASEVWSGVAAASGTATFYRHVAVGDDGTLSTTQVRIQGNVNVIGADMNVSNTSIISGATQNLNAYSITLPTA